MIFLKFVKLKRLVIPCEYKKLDLRFEIVT